MVFLFKSTDLVLLLLIGVQRISDDESFEEFLNDARPLQMWGCDGGHQRNYKGMIMEMEVVID